MTSKLISRRLLVSGIGGVLVTAPGVSGVSAWESESILDEPSEVILDQVLQIWKTTSFVPMDKETAFHGVSDSDLAVADKLFGFQLPGLLRTFYEATNGGWFLGGNLNFEPLLPENEGDMSVVTNGDLYRSWEWPIPSEFLPIGGDGQDTAYGLWIDTRSKLEPLVVAILGPEDAFAVVGVNFARFLVAETVFWLQKYEEFVTGLGVILDQLSVPVELRASDSEKVDRTAISRWSNPGTSVSSDNDGYYDNPMSESELRVFISGFGRD